MVDIYCSQSNIDDSLELLGWSSVWWRGRYSLLLSSALMYNSKYTVVRYDKIRCIKLRHATCLIRFPYIYSFTVSLRGHRSGVPTWIEILAFSLLTWTDIRIATIQLCMCGWCTWVSVLRFGLMSPNQSRRPLLLLTPGYGQKKETNVSLTWRDYWTYPWLC